MPRKFPVKPGDCFRLGGDHLLLCGDATKKADIDRLVGKNGKVALIACDVPYGIAAVQSKAGFGNVRMNKEIANDDFCSDEEYADFTKRWLSAIKPHLVAKNSVYVFNSDRMIFALRDGMLKAGAKLSQLIVWVKNQAVMNRKDYLVQHELIAYGWFGTHAFAKSQDKSVLFYPKPARSAYHPTMKPLPLMRRLILNSSAIGDYVYDGFCGSGQTLLACEQTARKCFAMEIDPGYCATILERYAALTNKKVGLTNRK